MVEARALPDDFVQLTTATRYQLRFFRRSYRALALVILMLVVSVLFLGVDLYLGKAAVQLGSGDSATFLAARFGGLFTILITVVAALLGGDAIATDFGSGTGYYALVLPVRRAVLLLGRYLGAVLVAVGVTMIYFVFQIGSALYFFGDLPGWSTLTAFGLTILVVLAYVAFAFLLSALFRRPVVSIVVAFLLLILVFTITTSSLETFGIEPWFMINYGAQAISQSLVALPHMTSMEVPIGNGMTMTVYSFNPYVWEGALILFGYLVASLAISILIYWRKELKG